MTQPDPAHVDALAFALGNALDPNLLSTDCEDAAAVILTTTDPAALDALEDALVRAGRLTRTTGVMDLSGHRLVTDNRPDQPTNLQSQTD
jgi:hypothetical protein